MSEINPCPFCENRPEPVRVGDDDGGYWSVEHQHSGEWREMFIGCHGDTEKEAILGWNYLTHQFADAQLRAECGELREQRDRLLKAGRRSLSWLASYRGGGALDCWDEMRRAVDPLDAVELSALSQQKAGSLSQAKRLAVQRGEPLGGEACPKGGEHDPVTFHVESNQIQVSPYRIICGKCNKTLVSEKDSE